MSSRTPITSPTADTTSSFAFVEYESRRDADDAYHEMHNKRIGRDDLLKIEVFFTSVKLRLTDGVSSGLAHLLLLRGDLTLDVIDLAIAATAATTVANGRLLAAVADLLLLEDATTLLARMIAVIVTEITMTAAAPAALTTVTVR